MMKSTKEWKKLWLAAGIGMGVGVVAGSAYLLLGGEQFRELAPRWAAAVFYPGFVAAQKTYVSCQNVATAKVVGVATVGLTYAAIAVLIYLVWHLVKRKA